MKIEKNIKFFSLSDRDLILPSGVFLFLGYSLKDENLLKKVTGEGVMETIGAIQGLVSYHNINGNKVCINSSAINYLIWSFPDRTQTNS